MVTGFVAAAPGQFTTIGEVFTVNCAEPVTAETVARMATGPPVLTDAARPFPSTVATAELALAQVGAGAAATTLPRASRAVAVNCCVVQRGMDAVAGSTETLATICWTVTAKAGLAT
jgi:hypothetical protein